MFGRVLSTVGTFLDMLGVKSLQGEAVRASDAEAPDTPHLKPKRRVEKSSYLLDLPEELLEHISTLNMGPRDMCALALSCTRLNALTTKSRVGDAQWRVLFEERFGSLTDIQLAAAKLAGGWKRLHAARHLMDKEAAPWQKPSSYEVDAAVKRLASASAAGTTVEGELCIVFLVDGSGSVTEDDFSCMTQFMQTAVNSIAAMGHPNKVAVLQFSNDVRVEQSCLSVDVDGFAQLMQNMHRMNGGTNISLAVQKAGQLLKPLSEQTRRVLVLLTDGRVDSHQARDAHDMARRLADEQPHVELYAFGVGRGVDKQELVHIISAKDPEGAEGRYMGLCVLDEAPW